MISPLLANVYLHWFEKVFHGPQGPATWAKAKLVRYAEAHKVNNRIAAYMLAIDRVATVLKLRGIYA